MSAPPLNQIECSLSLLHTGSNARSGDELKLLTDLRKYKQGMYFERKYAKKKDKKTTVLKASHEFLR